MNEKSVFLVEKDLLSLDIKGQLFTHRKNLFFFDQRKIVFSPKSNWDKMDYLFFLKSFHFFKTICIDVKLIKIKN